MEIRNLNCKSCGAPIEVKNINRRRGWARCTYCGAVINILPKPTPPTPRYNRSRPAANYNNALRPRPSIPMPEGIEVAELDDSLQITYKPNNQAVALFMLFFFLFPLMWVFFPFLYFILVRLLNHTILSVRENQLSYAYGPLPWFNDHKTYRADLIEQLYTREIVQRSDNGTSHTYQVNAIFKDGTSKKLIETLTEPEQALFIEQEIEHYLHIQDRPLPMEFPRL